MLVFPALVTPLRHELGLSLADALQLAFLGYLLFGLGALPAGMITDRWSARWMLALNVGLSGAGAALAGLSTSPTMLVFSLALMGIGASIYHPTGMALISRTFRERRGRALATNGVFGNVGLASAPIVTGLLTAAAGWRAAYLVLAAPGLLGALWIAVQPIDETTSDEPVDRATPDHSPPALKRYFVLLCAAMTLGGLAYRASSLVMPSYFEQKASFLVPTMRSFIELFGGDNAVTATAATLTSLVYLVGIVGQIMGGRIADKHELRSGYVAFHLATLPALVAMIWLAELPLVLATMLYLLFSLGMQPIENSLVAKLTPSAWRSTAYGLKFILTFGIGSFAVMLVGGIEQRAGLSAVFIAVAGFEVVLVLLAATLWRVSRARFERLANA